ncbi:MAG: nickel pincer cofactor biosynthesis protein LarC [Magnetococcales bacterium]|nr:nickel pincer cofactor biosynthesis protein LarC [Magnetococcales bacterium]
MALRLHLDLSAGIAGDMFLGALFDLGLEQQVLVEALQSLPLPPWRLQVSRERRGGMSGLRVEVIEEGHHASHHHEEDHHHHHRRWLEVADLIGASRLPEAVKEKSLAIFRLLAEAEGAVHGIPPEEVHFHEVGAVDAIVDICGAAFGLWRLGIAEVTASPLLTGSGTVSGQHGVMPVPAPAVAELIRRCRIPLLGDAVAGEMATPTGVAILSGIVSRYGASGLTGLDRVGCGLGRREVAGRANALRLLAQEMGSDAGGLLRDEVVVLTTHVDDMNPEWYGPLWERLLQAGALDVALLPLTMKKGRPGVRLEVVGPVSLEKALAEIVLSHTTTLGVRVQIVPRWILPRRKSRVTTPWGELDVVLAAGVARAEFVSLQAMAANQGWSLPLTQQKVAPYLLF